MEPIVLSKRRAELNISAKEMATLVGVHLNIIYKWESDNGGIAPSNRKKVAESYQIRVEEVEFICNKLAQERKAQNILMNSLRKKKPTPIVEMDPDSIGDALKDATGSRNVNLSSLKLIRGGYVRVSKKMIRF